MTNTKIKPAEVGLIGLGVMGRNLALNLADHGFSVEVYNRSPEEAVQFAGDHPNTPGGIHASESVEKFVGRLQAPRKIILLVPAGKPVDMVIERLLSLLERGDVVVDGGNSLWTDTIRREKSLRESGIHFVGSGVSGGEVGARFGPSLMPGGSLEAWKLLQPMWLAIAAKVDDKSGRPLEGAKPGKPVVGGEPCATYIGPNGAGHYVKMIHNGIEYGDMQLICEAFFILQKLGGMKPDELAEVFSTWNRGDLESFLIEITEKILQQKDPSDENRYLIEAILDTAGQKGTGKWTSISALDMGVATSTITEAVFARFISAIKEERVAASQKLNGPPFRYEGSKENLVAAVRDALYCAKVGSYAQGFALMREAQKKFGWELNFGEIAKIWRGGCIIRARFLQKITDAFERDPALPNLFLDSFFREKIEGMQGNWRKVIRLCAEAGIPAPAFMSALAYYDSYRTERLPANLLQAQRDYFGAHTYERVDRERGEFFHLDWSGRERHETKIG